jgi:hypothetical protein
MSARFALLTPLLTPSKLFHRLSLGKKHKRVESMSGAGTRINTKLHEILLFGLIRVDSWLRFFSSFRLGLLGKKQQ